MKRFLSTLLTAALLLGLMAFAPVHAEELPYYEIDVFSQNANFSGLQPGWFGKLIKDKFNIGLKITATNLEGGAAKLATLMSAGDLGEFLNFGNVASQDFLDARDAGMLFDLNQGDFLQKNAPFITENMPNLLKRAQLQYSGDGEAIWALVHDGITEGSSYASTSVVMPAIRYDLYKEIGAPTIGNIFDYLTVLKQMQEIEPVNADGQPVYGVSYFPDWDGDFQTFAKWFALHNGFDSKGMILLHGTEDKTQELLDEDSWYMQGVRWLYEANKLGLLDPDSITQTYAEYQSKLLSGRVLFSPNAANSYNSKENTDAGRGMYQVPFEGGQFYSWGVGEFGSYRTFGIGVKAKDPDRIMQFIDWICSDEGAMEMRNGPRGLTWDMDENNKPYLTEFGIQCMSDPTTPIPDEWGGGTYQDGMCKLEYPPRASGDITKLTGESIIYTSWSSYLALPQNPVLAQWSEDYGAVNSFGYARDNGMLVASNNESFEGLANLGALSMDLELVRTQVGEVIKQYSWKMAYATSDTEYDTLYKEMLEKAEGLGYREITDHYLSNAEKIMEVRRELTK